MLDALSKSFFHTLAGSRTIRAIASRYGMRDGTGFARRFIAGESLEEAIAAARALEARGLTLTLDVLGESVSSLESATAATRSYLDVIENVVRAGITRNLSLKLTQLGLAFHPSAALDNLRRILRAAQACDFFVRIDMENSPFVDVTLDFWETVWHEGYRNTGVVLQSALRRSEADMRRVMAAGGRIRLVKGAYNEPREVAYQAKADVDAAFVRMMRTLLADGAFPAIATHDPDIIDATKAFAGERGIPSDRFEFQMLYGIRRDLQTALKDAGYGMRIYLPFGREWFPYYMRRLGERPANVMFVLRGILGEHRERPV
jgi:proline dehydrogenase